MPGCLTPKVDIVTAENCKGSDDPPSFILRSGKSQQDPYQHRGLSINRPADREAPFWLLCPFKKNRHSDQGAVARLLVQSTEKMSQRKCPQLICPHPERRSLSYLLFVREYAPFNFLQKQRAHPPAKCVK